MIRREPARALVWTACFLTALFPAVALAQSSSADDKAVQGLQDATEDFLAGLAIDQEKAFQALLSSGPLEDETDKLLPKTQELKKFGAFPGADGVELVKLQRIGRDVVLLKYLQKFERLPVVWHFTYYRPDADDEFTLITVRFDTELELLGLALDGK